METNETLESEELIKLEKNSKGYNWTLKIFPIVCKDIETGERLSKIMDTDIDRLKLLNDRMIKEFGSMEA